MKKLIYLSLCGFIILLFGFTTVHADAGEERTIYLSATEYDYPPFSVTDNGKADGFSVELLKAVAKEMGITVSFKIDQWSILKEELKNGELDILPLVGYTLERDEIYDFTVPYIVMRGNIFVRKGETEILSQDDLYGKEVLVLDGDNSQEWAWSIGLDEELTATSTYTEAFLLLESGQYDAVLAQGLVGEKIISDEGIANIEPVYIYDNDGLTKIKLNLEGYEQKFCFAVVEGDSELLSILNEGLVIVSANGTYDELFQKWFPFYIETTPVSLQEVLLYVSVILIPILTVMFVLYVITVRRSVRIKTEQIEKNNFANQIIANAFQHKFSSAFERFDYILHELVALTESKFGLIFSVDTFGAVFIKSCGSKMRHSFCDHDTLIQMIRENAFIQKTIATKKLQLSNNYKTDHDDIILSIFNEEVQTILAVPIQRGNETNVIILCNKEGKFSEENIVQTTILMNGLWAMVEREEQNDKVEFMSFHDSLTGLYNRRFFEEELSRLNNPRNYPITIVMGDVNGLKLINDAFGHISGDQLLKNIGALLKKHCRANDIPARWGGDEFGIILPNTSSEGCEKLLKRIQEDALQLNQEYGQTSISFGYDTKSDDTRTIDEVFLSAEELMYHNKLEMVNSVRRETITTVINTLFEKSPDIKDHSERVSHIAEMIATEMGLSKNKIADIKTIGTIHDIGKIVIDLSILNSTKPLTHEEREIINMHPLSGSRMLSSTHEYTRLAPGVLHHHERWDGLGYPNGIEGDSIPIESRIIGVADAYDAMTRVRPYRATPLTKEEAIQEFILNKGTQFDPEIVDLFISKVVATL